MNNFEKVRKWEDRYLAKIPINYNTAKTVVAPKELILDSLEDLSGEQLRELGFGIWDEKEEEGLLFLIPISLYPILPEDLETVCIDGNKVKKNEMDLDTRFGYLAYGLIRQSDV